MPCPPPASRGGVTLLNDSHAVPGLSGPGSASSPPKAADGSRWVQGPAFEVKLTQSGIEAFPLKLQYTDT